MIENNKVPNHNFDFYMRTNSMPNVDDISENLYDVSKVNPQVFSASKNSFLNKKLQMKLPLRIPQNPEIERQTQLMVSNYTPYEGCDPDVRPKIFIPQANYLLTCDWEGVVKQFGLSDLILHRTYYNTQITRGARSMAATIDSKNLFIADLDGFVFYYSMESNSNDLIYHNRVELHTAAIRAMAITHDDKY